MTQTNIRTVTTEQSFKITDTNASSLSDFKGSSRTAQQYLLNLMSQMEGKSVVPINAYKEIVRFLIANFDKMVYLNNDLEKVEVKCRYGNPERTIAKLNEHDNIVLPMITLSQNSVVEADTRRRNSSLLIQRTLWDEESQRAERIVSFCDRPVTLQYDLNVWCKYMEDLDQLAQQIRLAFNPSIPLLTEFSKESQAFLASEANNYSFALADREDRILQKKFTVSVETYIKSPAFKITSTGKIEEVNAEITAL
jgi:hypothetical protein|tara:strand:+ start:6903 stop:7658 length:756 start_codon:yes stop_codon:yes gene_type:complete